MRIREKVPGLCMLLCVMITTLVANHYGDKLLPGVSGRLGTTPWHLLVGFGALLIGTGIFVIGMIIVRLLGLLVMRTR